MESDGPMKRLVPILLLIFLAGALWILLGKAPELSLPPGATRASSPNAASPAPEQPPPSIMDEKPSPEFQSWFLSESDSIENTTANPQEKELHLKALARRLSPVEIHYLMKQSLLRSNSARQRILAIYVLTLAPEVTHMALREVLRAPLEYPGQHPVHSPEEALAAQERSLRRLALDSLLERAKTSSEYREELRNFISQITDESLRSYAERSLEALI